MQTVKQNENTWHCVAYQADFVLFNCRLHMLCELEHSIGSVLQQPDSDYGKDSLNWCARIEMTQNSYRAKEPILALRRALLSLTKR